MYKKLLAVSSFIFLLVITFSVASAQTNTSTSSAARLKQQLQELQAQKQAAIQTRKATTANLRDQIKTTVTAKREAVKDAVAAARADFKAKLETIKDTRKKAVVSRIDTKLAAVNAKHTDRFTQVLGNLQILLDKISATITADTTSAQAAIDAAKTAVENQAAKTYTIGITEETALKTDSRNVVSQLRLDLMATHKLVIDAKQAVQALRASNDIMKNEATSSAN